MQIAKIFKMKNEFTICWAKIFRKNGKVLQTSKYTVSFVSDRYRQY